MELGTPQLEREPGPPNPEPRTPNLELGNPELGTRNSELFGPVRPRDLDVAVLPTPVNAQPPRVAADLAILDKGSARVRLYVDLDLFAAVRTGDEEVVRHGSGQIQNAKFKMQKSPATMFRFTSRILHFAFH